MKYNKHQLVFQLFPQAMLVIIWKVRTFKHC